MTQQGRAADRDGEGLVSGKPSSASRGGAEKLDLSHELRTPTHAILGHVELLLGGFAGGLSMEARAAIADIQQAGFNLLQSIDRVIETIDDKQENR